MTPPVGRLVPGARLAAALLLLTVCLLLRPARITELTLATGSVLIWALLCGLSGRRLRAALLTAALLLGPALLLRTLPGIGPPLFDLSFRSAAAVTIALALAGVLDADGLASVLDRWPLPRTVRAILDQVLRALPLLARESTGIARAIAVRGGASGLRAAFRVSAALPSVWLPRIVDRAERTVRAAEVRGWTGGRLRSPPPGGPR
jgi:energy-coupling factor transporter transmembrane protein EcfT